MKGVVLAGGLGTRLSPLTDGLNKHLLPIYDAPMVYYPINSLVTAGITDIMIVTGGGHANQFVDFLGSGDSHGCSLVYSYQTNPGGIADALSLAEAFVGMDPVCVILGDNIFAEDIKPWKDKFLEATRWKHPEGCLMSLPLIQKCQVVCKAVDDPEHYGVFFDGSIEEKPKEPKSNLAVTGLYFYTADVFNKISRLSPSDRGELEVTDLNNMYAKDGNLHHCITKMKWWDCGIDINHMLTVSNEIKLMKQGMKQ